MTIAHELFQSSRVNKSDKKSFYALKINMNKAYDWIEWDFFEEVLRKYGFR